MTGLKLNSVFYENRPNVRFIGIEVVVLILLSLLKPSRVHKSFPPCVSKYTIKEVTHRCR